MKKIVKIACTLFVTGLLGASGLAFAEEQTATGTVNIVNEMASTITMTDKSEVVITIEELGEPGEVEGSHVFEYKNHTFGNAKITARIDEPTSGFTLTALPELTVDGYGVAEPPVALDTTARPIISNIPATAGHGVATINFQAIANGPIENAFLTVSVTYTIAASD